MDDAEELRIVCTAVAHMANVPYADVLSRKRSHCLVSARSLTWLYLHEALGYPTSDIARHYGYDHSTVRYHIRQMRVRAEIDERIARRIDRVYEHVSMNLADYTATRLNEQS